MPALNRGGDEGDTMDTKIFFVGIAVIAVLFLSGCIFPAQQKTVGENVSAAVSENVSGVSIENITVPDINESEADFPLPV